MILDLAGLRNDRVSEVCLLQNLFLGRQRDRHLSQLQRWCDEVLLLLPSKWRDLVGDQLICQIDFFAMVLVRWEWQLELSNRRVLLFVVNNSARSGVVKGRSDSPMMDDFIKAFNSIEVHLPFFWWVERVPSKSNPGDEPFRFEGKASATHWNAQFLPGFKCQTKVADCLIKTASQRRLGCLSGGNGNRSVPGE